MPDLDPGALTPTAGHPAEVAAEWVIRYTWLSEPPAVRPRYTYVYRATSRERAVELVWRTWMTPQLGIAITGAHVRALPDGAWEEVWPEMACGQGRC